MPFLKKVVFNWETVERKNHYSFNVPALQLKELDTNSNVIFFVGDNGAGKSTLLEAIAFLCGFGSKGGGKYNKNIKPDGDKGLESVIKLVWQTKINHGFFLRAETFHSFAKYIDELANDPFNMGANVYGPYGGKSLNQQSHGESFFSLFNNRFKTKGLYILDEPEAALSPHWQLAFLRIIRSLEQSEKAQFLIATHSPIIMAYPGALIYSFTPNGMRRVEYEETEHYQLTKAFLNNRDSFLHKLFDEMTPVNK